MQRDFARDGNAALVRTKVIVGGCEVEFLGQLDQLPARTAVKLPLGVGVASDAFAKIE